MPLFVERERFSAHMLDHRLEQFAPARGAGRRKRITRRDARGVAQRNRQEIGGVDDRGGRKVELRLLQPLQVCKQEHGFFNDGGCIIAPVEEAFRQRHGLAGEKIGGADKRLCHRGTARKALRMASVRQLFPWLISAVINCATERRALRCRQPLVGCSTRSSALSLKASSAVRFAGAPPSRIGRWLAFLAMWRRPVCESGRNAIFKSSKGFGKDATGERHGGRGTNARRFPLGGAGGGRKIKMPVQRVAGRS